LRAADEVEREVRTFCRTLVIPGAGFPKPWHYPPTVLT
jgi:hypothetical protein